MTDYLKTFHAKLGPVVDSQLVVFQWNGRRGGKRKAMAALIRAWRRTHPGGKVKIVRPGR